MPQAMRVLISLPSTILDSVEQERRKRGQSRSEFFRQAIEAFLNDLQRREDVDCYVRGYLEYPEEPLDAAFHASLLATLEEWNSPEDGEAFRDL